MRRHAALLVAALGLSLAAGQAGGSEQLALLPVDGEDDAGIEAIALYPEPVRDAILEASTQPALIVKLAMLQGRSSAAFEDLLADYPRHTQEAIWDLVRFPGLVDHLVEGAPHDDAGLAALAADYPPEVRRTIAEYGGRHADLLGQVLALDRRTRAHFGQLLEDQPRAVRDSFERLLHHPEVLAILSEDMSRTILLGEAYKASPRQVRERAAQLHLELAQERAESLSRTPPDTPAAAATPTYTGEYADVARAYAERYAYEDALDGDAASTADTRVRVTYHTYPYPYWYGYPRWYATPAWGLSLGWYITPRVRASVAFYPHAYYRLAAPRHHVNVWARKRAAPRSKPRPKPSRR